MNAFASDRRSRSKGRSEPTPQDRIDPDVVGPTFTRARRFSQSAEAIGGETGSAKTRSGRFERKESPRRLEAAPHGRQGGRGSGKARAAAGSPSRRRER
jgi:hypothetical protein